MIKNKINHKDNVKLSQNQILKKFILDSKQFFNKNDFNTDDFENFPKTLKQFIRIY